MSLQKNTGAVKRFKYLMKFSAWLQNLPNRMTPAPFRLLQIGSAFWQSRVLHTAARLDIATLLGDRQLRAEEIAVLAATSPDATFRLLRMLAAMGIFTEVSPRVFANNPLSNCLREDDPQCVRAMILMHNSPGMSTPWYETLEPAVRKGEIPFKLAHGEELYRYMDTHPEFDALFSHAMDSVEALTGDCFATDFDWTGFSRIFDVGGSKGSKSAAILLRHPHLQAVIFDREGVISDAPRYWQKRQPGLLKRMRFQAGDVLESAPVADLASDIYLLSAVLHGFDDEHCVRILRNVATASKPSGAFIAVLEMILPEHKADLSATSFDMQMFMGTSGRERTLAEWQRLFDQSGVTLVEIVGLQTFGSILVLKASA